MKTSKTLGFFRPFEELKELIDKKTLNSGSSLDDAIEVTREAREKIINTFESDSDIAESPDPINEKNLFIEAMADVEPIYRGNRLEPAVMSRVPIDLENNTEIETLQQLNNLVESGEGFVVANTPEYIEGTGYHIHPEITKRLHRGDFSIQSHIDLHGLGVEEARDAFENFLKDAVTTGKRAVLVIHGRGLSSPDRPVLKTKVIEWLTRGPWRKWVIAFSSARSCDGGAGASYVLLRQRPLTKRHRKCMKKFR
jgi:DNA-nicking Smr family endonuclease